MEKKYVVKDFESQTFYCGKYLGWSEEADNADFFDTIEDAEVFIKYESGKFQIEAVYFSR
jgi:hypothetical protein